MIMELTLQKTQLKSLVYSGFKSNQVGLLSGTKRSIHQFNVKICY